MDTPAQSQTSVRPRYTAETHSYDEIANALASAEAALKTARADFNALRRRAAATKCHAPIEEFTAKEERVVRLGRVVQILQRELGKARRKRSDLLSNTLERHFIEVCREELDPKDMKEMLAEAQRRADKELCHV